MFLLYKLCFIFLFREYYTLKDTLHKKNLQLVQILKEDLQRNNDDYVGMRRSFSQTNDSQQSLNDNNRYKIITTRENKKVTKSDQSNNVNSIPFKETPSHNGYKDKEDVRIKLIDSIRRRVNDALKSKEVVNYTDLQRRAGVFNNQPIISKPLNKNQHPNIDRTLLDNNGGKLLWNDMHDMILNRDKLNQYRLQLLLNKTNILSTQPTTMTTKGTILTTTNTKNEKRRKKSTMMTLKKFMQENKGLLKEFIGSKNRERYIRPVTPVVQQKLAKKQSKLLSGRQLNNVLREDINRSINKYNLMELPNADMLDMFPAKGGRIHSKRMNGHLCHRHVLIPEGPKYNSRGKIYLPPHAAAPVPREYNATDAPALLLPKCCNCCHKSVLGCV